MVKKVKKKMKWLPMSLKDEKCEDNDKDTAAKPKPWKRIGNNETKNHNDNFRENRVRDSNNKRVSRKSAFRSEPNQRYGVLEEFNKNKSSSFNEGKSGNLHLKLFNFK